MNNNLNKMEKNNSFKSMDKRTICVVLSLLDEEIQVLQMRVFRNAIQCFSISIKNIKNKCQTQFLISFLEMLLNHFFRMESTHLLSVLEIDYSKTNTQANNRSTIRR